MLLTGITHAAARDKKHPFRGLTKQGRKESRRAAARFLELAPTLAQEVGGSLPPIGAIVSSPKVRCLATALLFAKGLGDLMVASEIQVDDSIKAGAVTGRELADLAQSVQVEHLLVSGHADLAKALPPGANLAAGAAKDGWFTTRPVVFTIHYAAGSAWDSARVLFGEGLVEKEWRRLL